MRAVVLSLLVTLSTSCHVVLGIEDLPAGRDPAGESAECAPCVHEGCSTEREACLADRACRELYGQIAACRSDDPACRFRAEKDGATAAQSGVYRALDACRRIQCTDECYGVRGYARFLDARCDCADDACAPFLRNCIRSGETSGEPIGECERKFACMAARPPPMDPEDAIVCTASDYGIAEMSAVRFCWSATSCGSCPLFGGGVLACKGVHRWAQPIDESIDFHFTVIDQRGRGIENVRVDACDAADCESCAKPEASGATAADGTRTLKLPTWGGGFHGCLQLRAAGKLTALWYTGRPLVRSEGLMRFPMFSADEITSWAKAAGVTLDDSKGHVMIATRDCAVTPVAGLVPVVPEGSGAIVGYLKAGEVTTVGPTDATGSASLLNLPPGPLDVVLRDLAGNEHGRTPAFVRKGTLTGVYVFPTPAP